MFVNICHCQNEYRSCSFQEQVFKILCQGQNKHKIYQNLLPIKQAYTMKNRLNCKYNYCTSSNHTSLEISFQLSIRQTTSNQQFSYVTSKYLLISCLNNHFSNPVFNIENAIKLFCLNIITSENPLSIWCVTC